MKLDDIDIWFLIQKQMELVVLLEKNNYLKFFSELQVQSRMLYRFLTMKQEISWYLHYHGNP